MIVVKEDHLHTPPAQQSGGEIETDSKHRVLREEDLTEEEMKEFKVERHHHQPPPHHQMSLVGGEGKKEK